MYIAAIDSLIFSSSQNSLFHMHLSGAKKKKVKTVFVLGASSVNKDMLSVFQTKIRNFLKLFPFLKDRFSMTR